MKKQKVKFCSPLNYQSSVLSGLLNQINEHGKILAQVKAVLPPNLSVHVIYASVINRRLLVYTESAVWASQLRFYNEVLRAAASGYCGKPVESMQIKILETKATKVLAKAKIPSLSAIKTIESDARCISDARLKNSLQGLCSSLKRLARN